MGFNFKKKLVLKYERKYEFIKDEVSYECSLDELGFGWASTKYNPLDVHHEFLIFSLKITRNYNQTANNLSQSGKATTSIVGSLMPVLHVDYFNENKEYRLPKYVMFGSSEKLADIKVNIYPIGPGELEECSAFGSLTRVAERYTYTEYIRIEIKIDESRFNEYVRLIENDLINHSRLIIRGASGFYSQCKPFNFSPYIYPEIKVLIDEHKVDGEEASPIKLSRLDTIEEFELELTTKNELERSKLRDEVYGIKGLIGDLKTPLWIIALICILIAILIIIWIKTPK